MHRANKYQKYANVVIKLFCSEVPVMPNYMSQQEYTTSSPLADEINTFLSVFVREFSKNINI